MKLYSYCIPVDDGAAPNPFWNECTLAICKPVIRRVAEVGDWIAGVGSKNVNGVDYSGRLVYAMRVSSKMSLRKYDNYCRKFRPEKIPDVISNDYRRQVGDCIYDYDGGYNFLLRRGVHGPNNIDIDQGGKDVLLSDQFYYFGDKAELIPPELLGIVRQGQGHQSLKNQFIKNDFIGWVESTFERNKLYGEPQVRVAFNADLQGTACGVIRCDDAKIDEGIDYGNEELPTHHWNYFLALESDLKVISRYIELHKSNFGTYSIGLAQLFLAACSEIDIVLRSICALLSDRRVGRMKQYAEVILPAITSVTTKKVNIPLHKIELRPLENWTIETPPSWWDSYNLIKHDRSASYPHANLGNTINALAALYVLIFELFRLYRGKSEGEFSVNLLYQHLQPKQGLFQLEGEAGWRSWVERPQSPMGSWMR